MQITNKRKSNDITVWTDKDTSRKTIHNSREPQAIVLDGDNWLNLEIEGWDKNEVLRLKTSVSKLDITLSTGSNLDKFQFSLPIVHKHTDPNGRSNADPDDNVTVGDDDTDND